MTTASELKPHIDAPTKADAIPVLHIAPSKGWVSLKLGELWEYRE